MFCILGETVVSALSLSRVALLCLLTVALNGTWVIEQPRSSLLMLHNRMSQLLSHFKVGLPKLDQFILILHDLNVLQHDNFQSLMRLPTNHTPSMELGYLIASENIHCRDGMNLNQFAEVPCTRQTLPDIPMLSVDETLFRSYPEENNFMVFQQGGGVVLDYEA
jgi:hypothetical protein